VSESKPTAAPERDSIRRWVDDYELRADNGDYAPNGHERLLIEDALRGYLEDSQSGLLRELYSCDDLVIPPRQVDDQDRAIAREMLRDCKAEEKLVELVARLLAKQPLVTPPATPSDPELLKRGRECAVAIMGFPEDAEFVKTSEDAWLAIDNALQLGRERNDELNALRMAAAPPVEGWEVEAAKQIIAGMEPLSNYWNSARSINAVAAIIRAAAPPCPNCADMQRALTQTARANQRIESIKKHRASNLAAWEVDGLDSQEADYLLNVITALEKQCAKAQKGREAVIRECSDELLNLAGQFDDPGKGHIIKYAAGALLALINSTEKGNDDA